MYTYIFEPEAFHNPVRFEAKYCTGLPPRINAGLYLMAIHGILC